MGITGGFGTTIDLERGTARTWVIGRDGVKRWADTDEPVPTGMQMLRITQCRDPLMWYAELVGELVPYCGKWREAYKSLEPAGYLNRVEFDDAEIVTLTPDGTVTPNSN